MRKKAIKLLTILAVVATALLLLYFVLLVGGMQMRLPFFFRHTGKNDMNLSEKQKKRISSTFIKQSLAVYR
ncbi:MAG: hypothetical protein IKI69_08040 [Oscillospiraceae bacterium]|nr:hypothetical protein [Oscillospiraceae bacterium]